MNRNGGWVQLVSLDGNRVLGRGQLRLSAQPPREGKPNWDGQLDSLHLDPSANPPAPGRYRLQFERFADDQVVQLDRVGPSEQGRTFARVSCVDECELPLSVTRLGGA